MKSLKKRESKILLSLTMLFTITSTVIPTKVSAETYFASISEFKIEGEVGKEITPVIVVLTMFSNQNWWPMFSAGDDYTHEIKEYFFTNFPDGLKSKVVSVDSECKILTLEIYGTPTKTMNEVATIDPTFKPNTDSTIHIKEPSSNYRLTVNSGTGSEKYVTGDLVTISANAPASGKVFKEWLVNPSDVILENAKSATTTFTMPDKNVEVTAIYGDRITPVSENKPVVKNTNITSPNTGNTSKTILCISFLALSGCALGYGLNKKKALKK
ncbi:MAG: hypothetical protein RR441_00215 [Longicatena sp.]